MPDNREQMATQAQLDRIFDRLVEIEPVSPGALVESILGGRFVPADLTARQATDLLSVLYMEYEPE